MEYEIEKTTKNAEKFTVPIECDEGAPESYKLRLAVQYILSREWHVKMLHLGGADLKDVFVGMEDLSESRLSFADLRGADLYQSNLSRCALHKAILCGTNLSGSDLTSACLNGAYLREANLGWATLDDADLSEADLRGVSFDCATMLCADLSGANLSGAEFKNANITNVNFEGSNYEEAELSKVNGENEWVKVLKIKDEKLVYTENYFHIYGEKHALDSGIIEKLWPKYKDWIMETVKLFPARPSKTVKGE